MPKPSIEVIIRSGELQLVRHVVGPGEYLVGRDPACEISVDLPEVSRRHARLKISDEGVFLEDLHSSCGTMIGSDRVESILRVQPPQSVRLGSAVLALRFVDENEAPIVPSPVATGSFSSSAPIQPPASKYQVDAQIAHGGIGAILDVQDVALERRVAMKVLLAGKNAAPEQVQRFIQEAKVLGQLEHPNIVPIHDLGQDAEGQVFYTMRLVKGADLQKVLDGLRDGDHEMIARFPLAQLLTIFQKVCDATAFAHSKGILHRDLKPENIRLGEYGEVLVMDWGLAKILQPAPATSEPSDGGEDGGPISDRSSRGDEALTSRFLVGPAEERSEPPHAGSYGGLEVGVGGEGSRLANADPRGVVKTLEGQVMGTPYYMAPEQAEGKNQKADERTDLYALGGILYHILVLRPPILGTELNVVLERIRSGDIRPPTEFNRLQSSSRSAPAESAVSTVRFSHCPNRKIPNSLSAVAMKALALKPSDRYQTVKELQDEIAAYQNGFAPSAERAGALRQIALAVKRHKILAAAAAVIVVLTAGFVWKLTETLAELRKSAPSFYAEAGALIEQKNLTDALNKISHAIALRPGEAEYHYLKGNVLQCLLRLNEARDAYAAALRHNPQHTLAAQNLRLSEELLRDHPGGADLPPASVQRLRLAMLDQGRGAEATALNAQIKMIDQALIDSWTTKLSGAGIQAKLRRTSDDGLELILTNSAIVDLNILRGMLLSRLNLGNTKVSDLSPLRGMPLTKLDLQGTRVADLSPLKGMRLKSLHLGMTKVKDLGPLRGMPLRDLMPMHLSDVKDLSPLQGMPLKYLNLYGCPKVSDLSALKGMELDWLDVDSSQVRDLTPLAGMPLKGINLGTTRVSDLSILAEMKSLENLRLTATRSVTNIGALKGLRLTDLQLDSTQVSDISALRGMPLKRLQLHRCDKLKDISPLTDCLELERLSLPPNPQAIDFLRKLPKLQKLTYTLSGDERWDDVKPVGEFWKEHDAQKRR